MLAVDCSGLAVGLAVSCTGVRVVCTGVSSRLDWG